MLLSHPVQVAVRATLYLALQPPGKLSPVHEIAKGTGLPRPYLAKIMSQLMRARLVRAFRGPQGGIELSRPPGAICLKLVVRAIEGAAYSELCALGIRDCSERNPCPIHSQWVEVRSEINRLLEGTTLASLAQGFREILGREPDSSAGFQREGDGLPH